MNTEKHTVTIPIADYNDLLVGQNRFDALKKNIENRVHSLAKAGLVLDGLNLVDEHQNCDLHFSPASGQTTVRFTTPKRP